MSFFFDLGCRPLRVLPADRVVTLYVIVRIIHDLCFSASEQF